MRFLRFNQKDLVRMLKVGREGRGEGGAVPEMGDPGGDKTMQGHPGGGVQPGEQMSRAEARGHWYAGVILAMGGQPYRGGQDGGLVSMARGPEPHLCSSISRLGFPPLCRPGVCLLRGSVLHAEYHHGHLLLPVGSGLTTGLQPRGTTVTAPGMAVLPQGLW